MRRKFDTLAASNSTEPRRPARPRRVSAHRLRGEIDEVDMAENSARDPSLYGDVYLERLRLMMVFFRDLVDRSGYTREEVAALVSDYALKHGYRQSLGEWFIHRLAGQMQWYGTRSFDVSHFKMDFVLRALGSSQAELERAISGAPTVDSAADESEERVLVSTFRRIKDPHLRRWMIADLMRTADLDAGVTRGVVTATPLGPAPTPPSTPPTDGRETLEEFYSHIEEALENDEQLRGGKKKPPSSTGSSS
jgi:hypothetical protein